MPELPEVETIKRDLEKVILGKNITCLTIKKPKLIKNKSFRKDLLKRKIKSVERVGKLLYFSLSGGKYLAIHLKMTGQLIFQKGSKLVAGGHDTPPITALLPNKYTHVIFSFADNSKLFFNDQRQFGYLTTLTEQQLDQVKSSYGPDPLSRRFSLDYLKAIIAGRKIKIKSLLLNQKLVAGIGNIYADEICFRAGVRPSRSVNKLSFREIEKLFRATKDVLKEAIKFRGTTFRDFRDPKGRSGNYRDRLKVYGRAGQICQKCGKVKISKIKISGRGTHYCPKCQK